VFNIVIISVPISLAQELSADEQQLYDFIMDYRKSMNLPAIPISQSLTYVAQTHSRDLAENRPDQDQCNLHSWSKKWQMEILLLHVGSHQSSMYVG
jgi:hypothetical protein